MIRTFLKNPQLQAFWPYALLAAAVLAAYANVYHNIFIFDDETLIQRNRYVLGQLPLSHIFLSSAAGGAGIINNFYRPLQVLVYTGVYALFGPSTVAFHALNVGLHAINACLLYMLGRKLGFRPVAVFLGTLIWALHPLHTEAVTYMSATADTLNVVFCLITLLMVLPEPSVRRIGMACPVFVLGLLSKETAVVLPLLLACCLFLVSPQRKNFRTYLRTWPLWALAIIYVVLRLTVLDFQKFDHSFDTLSTLHLYATDIVVRIYTCLATLPYYLQLLFYPVHLHYERQFPVYNSFWNSDVLSGFVIVVTAFCIMGLAYAKKQLPIVWGLLWFGAAHSLETGIAFPLIMRFLEHWMYVPSMGLILGMTESLMCAFENKWLRELQGLAGIVAFGIAVTFGVMTYDQNAIWRDDFTFYPNILKYGEPSTRALNNLGKAYADRGDYKTAMELFRRSTQIVDTLPEIHQNMASVLIKDPDWRQHPEELIAEMKRALELSPNFLAPCEGLQYVYEQLGDEKNAAIYRARAAEIRKTLMP